MISKEIFHSINWEHLVEPDLLAKELTRMSRALEDVSVYNNSILNYMMPQREEDLVRSAYTSKVLGSSPDSYEAMIEPRFATTYSFSFTPSIWWDGLTPEFSSNGVGMGVKIGPVTISQFIISIYKGTLQNAMQGLTPYGPARIIGLPSHNTGYPYSKDAQMRIGTSQITGKVVVTGNYAEWPNDLGEEYSHTPHTFDVIQSDSTGYLSYGSTIDEGGTPVTAKLHSDNIAWLNDYPNHQYLNLAGTIVTLS